jgi:hypothetical protein
MHNWRVPDDLLSWATADGRGKASERRNAGEFSFGPMTRVFFTNRNRPDYHGNRFLPIRISSDTEPAQPSKIGNQIWIQKIEKWKKSS